MNQTERAVEEKAGGEQWPSSALVSKALWLERQLCHGTGATHCVLAPDAAAAIEAALRAAGIGRGDAVLCTTFGQYSTLQAIVALGATPEFVDINPNTLNLDPYCLEYVIKKYRRTKGSMPKALISLDLFGLPCNYGEIEEICERNEIILIEDMSQAFGASYDGRKAGQFGRFAVASLQGSKLPGSLGEDGAVFCRNPEDEWAVRRHLSELAQQVVRLEQAPEQEEQDFSAQFTVMGEQLRQFRKEFARRQKVAGLYRERLAGHVKMQRVGERYSSAYSQFVISLRDNEMRSFVMDRLVDENIPCGIFYPVPLHQRQELGDWDRVILANAEMMAQRLLVLPMHSYLTPHIVDYISERLLYAIDAYSHQYAAAELA